MKLQISPGEEQVRCRRDLMLMVSVLEVKVQGILIRSPAIQYKLQHTRIY